MEAALSRVESSTEAELLATANLDDHRPSARARLLSRAVGARASMDLPGSRGDECVV